MSATAYNLRTMSAGTIIPCGPTCSQVDGVKGRSAVGQLEGDLAT
jgi:hypothetical protein